MLLQKLLTVLQNDALFLVSIGAGCAIMGAHVEKRNCFILRWVLGILILIAATVVLNDSMRTPEGSYILVFCVLKYLILFLLFFLNTEWCYRVSWQVAAFIATVSYCIQNVCERLIEVLREWYAIPLWVDRPILACMMLAAILYYSRSIMVANGFSDNSYRRMDKRLLVLIALVTVAINIVLDMCLRAAVPNASHLARTYLHLTSAVVSFQAIVLSMCQFRQADSDKKAEIAANLLHNSQRRYEEEKLLHDTINIKCHDIRHQLAALGQMGYNKELREIGKLVNIYDTRYRTGCDALDVILSNKALTCVSSGITLTCVADGKQMGFMDTADVYALFGNILDNAVDAASQLTDPEKKIITVSVRVNKGMLWITEQNFFLGTLGFRDELPVTTKKDTMYHGYGMKSIAILVERYSGRIEITADDNIYSISIMIPLPTEK